MKVYRLFITLAVVLLVASLMRLVSPASAQVPTRPTMRFAYVDVYLDSAERSLAAYQVEFSAASDVKILSLEGGEHVAFKAAPYYDPTALNQNRVVLAAYSTGEALPTARTRVARVHVQAAGAVTPRVKLVVAGSTDARAIDAAVSFTEGEAR